MGNYYFKTNNMNLEKFIEVLDDSEKLFILELLTKWRFREDEIKKLTSISDWLQNNKEKLSPRVRNGLRYMDGRIDKYWNGGNEFRYIEEVVRFGSLGRNCGRKSWDEFINVYNITKTK